MKIKVIYIYRILHRIVTILYNYANYGNVLKCNSQQYFTDGKTYGTDRYIFFDLKRFLYSVYHNIFKYRTINSVHLGRA